MKSITMLEIRQNSAGFIKQLKKGDSLTLTYRGKPVANLIPILSNEPISEKDPFYRLGDLADSHAQPLSNEQIDHLIYGKK